MITDKRKTNGQNRTRLLGIASSLMVLMFVSQTHAQSCLHPTSRILPDDGTVGDAFGASVSISGTTAVINGAGSAYVFTYTDGAWTQYTELLQNGGGTNSVSISGDTIVLGAPLDNVNGARPGSAYVFRKINGLWIQEAKLLADDGAHLDSFGRSVAIDSNTIVVGAHQDDDQGNNSGSAYVFTRSGGVWTQQSKLIDAPGNRPRNFGIAVSISGDTIVVGVNDDEDIGFIRAGSAHVFTRTGVIWTLQGNLRFADKNSSATFVRSVSISGDTVIVGTVEDTKKGQNAGSAYVYVRTSGAWSQQAKLLPMDGSEGQLFGTSVATSGDMAVVGAFGDDSAYVFARTGETWSQQTKIQPIELGGGFGGSVSINAKTVLIGANRDRVNGSNSGSAYITDYNAPSCTADLTGDCALNFFDISEFLSAFSAKDIVADFNNDGLFNFFDISAFLNAYSAGCP